MQELSAREAASFRQKIYNHYHSHPRPMPWREDVSPYCILVSEVMLQQTQVPRVITKYPPFIERFPTVESLATAELADVLPVWQGLGYNRRARMLRDAARMIVHDFDGTVPRSPDDLVTLPGIGPATAASIAAFAYNAPVVFIETNIRTVFIHEFFPGRDSVHDRDILPLVEQTLDGDNSREWYWALMDYGVMLKASNPNPSRRSAHHTRQSKFEGSDRQIRGAVIRHLTEHSAVSREGLVTALDCPAERMGRILDGLIADGMIVDAGGRMRIE